MVTRPSETVTAAAGSILGALVGILAAYNITVPSGVQTGIIVLVGWVGAFVTWYVARKQRAGAATSAADGKVS